jgi:hypothetical protein
MFAGHRPPPWSPDRKCTLMNLVKHLKHMMEGCRGTRKEASPRSLDATQTPDLRAWRTSSIVTMLKKEESIAPFNVITRRMGLETPSFLGTRKMVKWGREKWLNGAGSPLRLPGHKE